jgi:hypothetical protein
MRVTSRTARGPVQTGLWTLRPCGTRDTHSLTYSKVKWTKRRGPVTRNHWARDEPPSRAHSMATHRIVAVFRPDRSNESPATGATDHRAAIPVPEQRAVPEALVLLGCPCHSRCSRLRR